MATQLRSFFQIGVFDPMNYNSWPWHFHYENGIYLSPNFRFCKFSKAAKFTSPEQAREFFNKWKNPKNYKMEVLEHKERVEVPDPFYPPEHPNSILKEIQKHERSNYACTAHLWFCGDDIFKYTSKSTLRNHRKKLLPYGIDIFTKPKQLLERNPIKDDETWHLQPANFKVVE